MRRENDDGERLVFHTCIEWSNPETHRYDKPIDGALCIVFYKIKNLDRSDYERVKQQTQSQPEWDVIRFDDDIWNSDLGIFYVPVSNGSEVECGFETLQKHFLEYGDTFGNLPGDEPV
ncbi:hypothetical protein HSB1_18610 [Halogranum salarium B-1]|uniref:Uncharacterized protein n=2 Tax=Halogranum rubrum TaxID=553466 RepID=J3A314_9EURY|nr:hypothetical protein HSB1_18610 [Halogranum salarium B-1]